MQCPHIWNSFNFPEKSFVSLEARLCKVLIFSSLMNNFSGQNIQSSIFIKKSHLLDRLPKSVFGAKYMVYFCLLVLVISRISYIKYTPELALSTFGSPEENLHVLVGAKNLVKYGWSATCGLPDYVTSPINQDHPVVYTHFPPLPTIIAAICLKLNLGLKAIRLCIVVLNCFGWVMAAYFIQKIYRLGAQYLPSMLLFLFVTFSVPQLIWSDHFEYGLTPLLVFSPFFISQMNWKNYLKELCICICLFTNALYNYKIATITLFSWIAYYLLEGDAFSRKKIKTISICATAAFAGILLHVAQNITFLGTSVAINEIWLTLQNRVFGNPTNSQLSEWFKNHNIVLWGSNKVLEVDPLIKQLGILGKVNVETFKRVFPIYLWIPVIVSYLYIYGYHFAAKKLNIFILSLFIGVLSWYILFPAHALGYTLSFVDTLPGLIAGVSCWNLVIYSAMIGLRALKQASGSFNKNKLRIRNIKFVYSFIILALITHVAYRSLKFTVDFQEIIKNEKEKGYFEQGNKLSKYAKNIVWTNMTSVWVGFFTNSVVPGRATLEALSARDLSKCLNIFINSGQSLERLMMPEYFIFSSNFTSGNTEGHDEKSLKKLKDFLDKNAALIEEHYCYSIYRL